MYSPSILKIRQLQSEMTSNYWLVRKLDSDLTDLEKEIYQTNDE